MSWATARRSILAAIPIAIALACARETPIAAAPEANVSTGAKGNGASPPNARASACALAARSMPPSSGAGANKGGRSRDTKLADQELTRGLALRDNGDHQTAKRAFGNAIAADPWLGLAYVEKAESHLYTDNDHAAMRPLLVRGLELLPENPRAHLRYAELLAESGETESAEAHFRCAIELRPDLVEARRWLAQRHLTKGELGDAEREIKLAVADAPNDIQTRVLFGNVLAAEHRPLDAAKELNTAAVIAGRSAALYRRAGALFEEAGDRASAKRARASADRIDPPPKDRKLRPLLKKKPKTARK